MTLEQYEGMLGLDKATSALTEEELIEGNKKFRGVQFSNMGEFFLNPISLYFT